MLSRTGIISQINLDYVINMAVERLTTSRLFLTSLVEGRLDVDEKYDKAFNTVFTNTRNSSEKERHDVYNKLIDESKLHEEVCIGLMVGILSEPNMANQYFHDLVNVCRDGLKTVCDNLIQTIIGEKFQRLLETTRKQTVWLVKKLVHAGVAPAEGVVWCLLRQMAGGDVSPQNIWLADSLCDIFRDNRPWLERFNVIIASVVYSFLRIIEDHMGQQYNTLRQKEVTLVVSLLRERFSDCLIIGRDLVRLLQNLSKIPEIESFFKDLMFNPTLLTPSCTGIMQILNTRTSRRFLLMRLTPEMEKMIYYLCSEVKFGTQKRYQDWFQRQFLNTPESQTLRCDLIRFIIGCIHPPNEVLCSDIIPRWAVIGWLLSSSTSPIVTANSKLALFYDWLFFSGENDNIMNIEPGILVMYHSIKPHPMLTASLLDFLCRVINLFHPQLVTVVRAGVKTSLRQILEKRVIQNIEPLFDNNRMDPDLRKLVKETFPEFCSPQDDNSASQTHSSSGVKMMSESGQDIASDSTCLNISVNDVDEAMFSDEEEENISRAKERSSIPSYSSSTTHSSSTPQISTSLVSSILHSSSNMMSNCSLSKAPPSTPYSSKGGGNPLLNNTHFSTDPVIEVEPLKKANSVVSNGSVSLNGIQTTSLTRNSVLKSVEQTRKFNEYADALPTDMRDFLLDFKSEKETSVRNGLVQKICDLVISDDLEETECDNLGGALSLLLQDATDTVLPNDLSHESLRTSLSSPLYTVFEHLLRVSDEDHRRHSLLQLLCSLHHHLDSLGYKLLYFLKAHHKTKQKNKPDSLSLQMYRDLWKSSGQKDFSGFIVHDVSLCSERDPRLVCWLLPHLYSCFPKHTTGNAELVYLVLQRLDAAQLHDLVCLVMQGNLTMFDNSSFANILDKSLGWETLEQIFLWQLAHAHEIPVDCTLSVLHKLTFCSHHYGEMHHSEALSNILMMLRRESPSETVLRHLLQREMRAEDPTVATILQYWVQRYEDKMAKLLNDIVNNKPPPSPNKRKRNQVGSKQSSHVTLDQLLSHLNHLRTECDQTKFFNLATMQEMLVSASAQCSEVQRKTYKELLSLITPSSEDDSKHPNDNTNTSNASARTKTVGTKRGRRPLKAPRRKQDSDSEEETTEEEDLEKPARKRKKNSALFASDSD